MTSTHWTFLLLLIPLAGGCVAWYKFHTIALWEWASGFGAAALILVITFTISSCVMRHDREILSGYAYKACHTPWWRAEWTELETYTTTDSKGNTQEHTRTVTKSETHQPRWWVETTVGNFSIGEAYFNKLCNTYGSYKERGHRPDHDEGDLYDYFSDIKQTSTTGPDIPVHTAASWSNPFLGSDTIRLGQPVSDREAEKLGLHKYPETDNPFVSNRVIGAPVSPYRWDQMCAELGAAKKVNLTIINFGNADMAKAVKQRDYWKNGRKNDLVLCYGDGWSYVFGWSKHELVKQELQTLLLHHKVNEDLPKEIAKIVRSDFEPFEWDKEEVTPAPVPTGAVIAAFILMLATQVGLGYVFHTNEFGKGDKLPWQNNY